MNKSTIASTRGWLRTELHILRRGAVALTVLGLGIAALAGAETPAEGQETAIPVLIDTDMDSDDAMAILYLFASKKVKVLGLSVSGNGLMLPIDGVPLALGLAALGNRPGLPVAYGRAQGLLEVGGFPDTWRQGVKAFYSQADLPAPQWPPYPKPAADLIIDLIHSSKEKVTVLGLGPNTNIALAFAQDPSIIANVEQVVLSAGAFKVKGNVTTSGAPLTFLDNTPSYRSLVAAAGQDPVAEYNVFLDAPATSAIIESGAKVLFSPLDASEMAQVTTAFVDSLEGRPQNPVTRFVLADIEPLITQKIPTYFWDPVAAALIIDPELCTDLQTPQVHVVVESSANFGRTEAGQFGKKAGVCFAIDAKGFYSSFLDTLSPAP